LVLDRQGGSVELDFGEAQFDHPEVKVEVELTMDAIVARLRVPASDHRRHVRGSWTSSCCQDRCCTWEPASGLPNLQLKPREHAWSRVSSRHPSCPLWLFAGDRTRGFNVG
jgi:hypothetical protein